MAVKGVVLAGGRGSRLYPATLGVCKQLLPIFDKPMIYYPFATLMQAGIRDILLISTPEDLPRFRDLFGDGTHLGLSIAYAEQPQPEGIAQALLIAAPFIGSASIALILGDNIYYGHYLPSLLSACLPLESGGVVFGYEVKDPERYGVLVWDKQGRVVEIVEKPLQPPSSYAVTGLYFYDNDALAIAKELRPSARGELEITDVNRAYLARGTLDVRLLGRGFAWLDTGTPDALQKASSYVQTIQERQGIKIACLEEIALQMGFIDRQQFGSVVDRLPSSDYRSYLERVATTGAYKHP